MPGCTKGTRPRLPRLRRHHTAPRFEGSWLSYRTIRPLQLGCLHPAPVTHTWLANPSNRRTTVSTRLSGVEAPDVSPICTAPRPGSHPAEIRSCLASTGLCLISDAETRQSGVAMWYVGTRGSHIRARLHVL